MLVNFEAVMSPNNALSARGKTGSKTPEYLQSNNICLNIKHVSLWPAPLISLYLPGRNDIPVFPRM